MLTTKDKDQVVSVALDLSRYAACKLIIVESEEDKVEMYKHWGFKPIENFEERRNTMFIIKPQINVVTRVFVTTYQ